MSRDDDAFPTAALAAPPTRRGVLAMAGPLAASLLAPQAALAQATGARRTVPIPVDVAALARLTIAAARTAPAREEPDDPESATARLDRIFADAARRWEAAPSSAAARALRQGLDDIARTGDPTWLADALRARARPAEGGEPPAPADAAAALRDAATLLRHRDLLLALDVWRRAAAIDAGDVWTWLQIGRLCLRTGRLPAAEAAFRQAIPAASDERDKALLAQGLACVEAARGNPAAALAAGERFRLVAERLAQADPGDAGRRRDLAIGLDGVGAARLAAGEFAPALAAFERGRALRQALATAEPLDADRRADLASALVRVGSVREAQGDWPAATKAFEDARAILARLAAPALAVPTATLPAGARQAAPTQAAPAPAAPTQAASTQATPAQATPPSATPTHAAAIQADAWRTRDLASILTRLGDVALARGDAATRRAP